MKKALITGVSGQDGSYLAEYLLDLGYSVYGLVRRETETVRFLDAVQDQIELLYGDMRDPVSLEVAFAKAMPDEVYNLAGQVFVPTSWHLPAETFDINVGGLARLLNMVERLKPETRVYQASSSEMYGNLNGLRNEETPLRPTSPYGVSKTAAHNLCERLSRARNFRGRRNPVQSRIAAPRTGDGDAQDHAGVGRLGAGQEEQGQAGQYAGAPRLGLCRRLRSRHACHAAAREADGLRHRHRRIAQRVRVRGRSAALPGSGRSAGADVAEVVNEYVEVDPKLFRTGEIHDLRGDATLARQELNWTPEVDFPELVRRMVEGDTGVTVAPRAGKKRYVGSSA